MDPEGSGCWVTKLNFRGKSLYIKVTWNPNNQDLFHIKMFDGDNNSWSGVFSKESAKKYKNRTEETEAQYNKNAMRYLKGTVQNECSYNFVADENDSDIAVFTWKKRFEENLGPVFLVHGSVPLQRDKNVASKDLLLDFLLEENEELRSTIEKLNVKTEAITSDLNKCKTELEKFVQIKNSVENDLYGKFVQLLNAKKRRIEVLESNLHKFSDRLGGDH